MQYTNLGTTGVQVSRLCFGTMSFGGDADEEMSASLFKRCRDAGINFFDCADMYQNGRAEEILGRLMAGCRDELVITSKAYFPTGPDRNARGASRRHLFDAIAASLKRLGTDHVDLYFIHRFDEETALEETLRALEDMTQRGMILYPAASNFAAWQVQKALGISAREGWARFACIQPMYNLVRRQAEVEILPMAQDARIGVITYSPLAGGLLTGKYGTGEKPAAGRLVNHPRYAARYADPHEYEVAERFAGFARDRGLDPAGLAVAWAGSHPGVTAPIIGARNVTQLESSLKAAEIEMTAALRDEVSALSPTPPLATDRSEERVSAQFLGK